MSTPNKQQSGTNTPRDLSGNPIKKPENGWTQEQENLLAKWADYAACYRWLHDRTEKKFSILNNMITIPVIILSTVNGSASVGLNGLVGNDPVAVKYAQIGIGVLSLFTSILTTLGSFFRFAQNSEAHRSAAIGWSKFNRSISVELAQKPEDRLNSIDFINICRAELDRLIEQSPQIPDDILDKFDTEFEAQEDLAKPDICNNIEHTTVYNNSKARMKQVVAEMALNLKHRKRLLRDEVLPDLDLRMKKLIDKSFQEYERKQKDATFRTSLEKKLNEVVANDQENVVIDIIGHDTLKPQEPSP